MSDIKAKAWGVLWRVNNKASGKILSIMYAETGTPVLFRTKRLAKEWIRQNHASVAHRTDLRAEPYGWRMPIPVRVSITFEAVGGE